MRRFLPILLALILMAVPAVAAPKASPSAAAHHPQVKTESGLIYQDIVVGKGAVPREGQIVVVHYRGWLRGGRLIDSSYERNMPMAFVLGDTGVLKGWREGISTMHVGGKRRLIMPPSLGYGDEIVSGIPPDSTLEFEIQLLGVSDVKATPSPQP